MPFVHLIIIYQESVIGKKVKDIFAIKNYSGRFTRYEFFYDIRKKSNKVNSRSTTIAVVGKFNINPHLKLSLNSFNHIGSYKNLRLMWSRK